MERGLLIWIAIGVAIGVLSRVTLFRRDPGGPSITVLLGMAGALFAGFLGRVGGFYGSGQAAGMAVAAAGAVAMILLYRMVLRRRS